MEQLIKSYSPETRATSFSPCSPINMHVDCIYVINLEKDVLRATYMQTLLAKLSLSHTFVTVKPPTGNQYCTAKRHTHGRPMSLGETGCYLSHMWCLRDIIGKGHERAIILEDDVVPHKLLCRLYASHVSSRDCDFLMLGAADHRFSSKNHALVKDGFYRPGRGPLLGTHAIYYSLHGATTLYKYRLSKPMYFDRDLDHVMTLFGANKAGVCVPNLFTVENSTTNLNHHFGISKHERNDYYYNRCYVDFKFTDYHFTYLDLFDKATLLDTSALPDESPEALVRALLRNYFNNDEELVKHHMQRLDAGFFSVGELQELLGAGRDALTIEYYGDKVTELCETVGLTPGALHRKRVLYAGRPVPPLLVHEHLDPSIKGRGYVYEVSKCSAYRKSHAAHLHCRDIRHFAKTYGEYIDRIRAAADVVITYSRGAVGKQSAALLADCTVLRVENRGMDVGAKFIAMEHLRRTGHPFTRILFLHSKSHEGTRTVFFDSLVPRLEEMLNAPAEIKGHFPPLIVRGDDVAIVRGRQYLEDGQLKRFLYRPLRFNARYATALCERWGLDTRGITVFPSGNCYCLSRDVAETLFSDYGLYCALSFHRREECEQLSLHPVHCFDHNWVAAYYRIPYDDPEFVYEHQAKNRLLSNVLQCDDPNVTRDGQLEHAFERMVFRVIGAIPGGRIRILSDGQRHNEDKIAALGEELSDCYAECVAYDKFDHKKYIQAAPALEARGIRTKAQAWRHWTSCGWHEGRAAR